MSKQSDLPIRVPGFGANLSAAQWIALICGGWAIILVWSVHPEIWQTHLSLVQDDARHHVVWLRQLADPEIFANDPAAAFFLSQSPIAYQALYWPAIWLGIDVVRWHFLFLAPLSCFLSTCAIYRFSTHILPTRQMCGLVTLALCTIFASQIMQGLQRNFALAIILFAWTCYLERRPLLTAIVFLLGANLYPVAAATVGFSILIHLLLPLIRFAPIDRLRSACVLAGGIAGVAGLTPFLLNSGNAGPTVLLQEAIHLPIFHPGGRSHFFSETLLDQIFCKRGELSNYVPLCVWWGQGPSSVLAVAATFAAVAAGCIAQRFVFLHGSDKQQELASEFVRIVISMVIAGTMLFVLSYVFAFRLYIPSRYSELTVGLLFWMGIALSAAAVAFLATMFLHKVGAMLSIAVFVVLWIAFIENGIGRYDLEADSEPEISNYLRTSPKSTVVAGFDGYLDSLPAFASRSSYVAVEFMVPYKTRYFAQMRDRISALKDALMAGSPSELSKFAEDQGISYFLLPKDQHSFPNRWKVSFPDLTALEGRSANIVESNGIGCVVAQGRAVNLIDAKCLGQID